MELDILPGKYVAAVSGGVDSMVMLDMLAKSPGLELVVAHFDHGVRPDSTSDRQFVEAKAKKLSLPFVYKTGKLGAHASEETARRARYEFLEEVRNQTGAQAVITAHHQDDLLETMLINLIRGTNRKGLSSLKSTKTLKRPLLNQTKNELRDYAGKHNIEWREDSTNSSPKYLRNRLRQTAMPRLTVAQRQNLLDINSRMQQLNQEIDTQIHDMLYKIQTDEAINRLQFTMLPHDICLELMAESLRKLKAKNLSKQLLARLVVAAKTAKPGTKHDVDSRFFMEVGPRTVSFRPKTS